MRQVELKIIFNWPSLTSFSFIFAHFQQQHNVAENKW